MNSNNKKMFITKPKNVTKQVRYDYYYNIPCYCYYTIKIHYKVRSTKK